MTVFTFRAMKLPQEEFEKKVRHPLFLKLLGLDYKLEKKAFYFFFARHLKIFLFGVSSYALYYVPVAQISILFGLEAVYFAWLIFLRPYSNYLKLLIEFVIHLVIIVIIFLAFLIHPALQIVPFKVF